MNICIYNYYEEFNSNNNIFRPESFGLVEGGEKPFLALKEKIEENGHTLSTIDQYSIEAFQKYIFLDYPTNNVELIKRLFELGKDLYLMIFESEIIKPDNWDVDNYRYFKRVFGWKDINLPNYSKMVIPQNLDMLSMGIPFAERKLACIVASSKYCDDKRELYSERRKIIRWFERKHPEDFSLFGKGWQEGEQIAVPSIIKRFLPSIAGVHRPYHSFIGSVCSKREVISKFRFNFCLENAKDIKGYVTEKIFDSLLSGTVPIYWGAPDIKDIVPESTFICYSDFNNLNDLYKYISTMSEDTWADYITEAKKYIESERAFVFSPEYFAKMIITEIL